MVNNINVEIAPVSRVEGHCDLVLNVKDKIVENLYRDRDEYIRDAIDEKLWKDFPTVMRTLVLEFVPEKGRLDA